MPPNRQPLQIPQNVSRPLVRALQHFRINIPTSMAERDLIIEPFLAMESVFAGLTDEGFDAVEELIDNDLLKEFEKKIPSTCVNVINGGSVSGFKQKVADMVSESKAIVENIRDAEPNSDRLWYYEWQNLAKQFTKQENRKSQDSINKCGEYYLKDYLKRTPEQPDSLAYITINNISIPSGWSNEKNPLVISADSYANRQIALRRINKLREIVKTDPAKISELAHTKISLDSFIHAIAQDVETNLDDDITKYLENAESKINDFWKLQRQIVWKKSHDTAKPNYETDIHNLETNLKSIEQELFNAFNLHLINNYVSSAQKDNFTIKRSSDYNNFYLLQTNIRPPTRQEGENLSEYFKRYQRFKECEAVHLPNANLPLSIIPVLKEEAFIINGNLRSYVFPERRQEWITNEKFRLLRSLHDERRYRYRDFDQHTIARQIDPLRQLLFNIHQDLAQHPDDEFQLCSELSEPNEQLIPSVKSVDLCEKYDDEREREDGLIPDTNNKKTKKRAINGDTTYRISISYPNIKNYEENHFLMDGNACSLWDYDYGRTFFIRPLLKSWFNTSYDTVYRLNSMINTNWNRQKIIDEMKIAPYRAEALEKARNSKKPLTDEEKALLPTEYPDSTKMMLWEAVKIGDNVPLLFDIRTGDHTLMRMELLRDLKNVQTNITYLDEHISPSPPTNFHTCVLNTVRNLPTFKIQGIEVAPVRVATRIGLNQGNTRIKKRSGVSITWAAFSPTILESDDSVSIQDRSNTSTQSSSSANIAVSSLNNVQQSDIGHLFNYKNRNTINELKKFFKKAYSIETDAMKTCANMIE